MNNQFEGISTHKELTIMDQILADRRLQYVLIGIAVMMTVAVLMALSYWLKQPAAIRPGVITGIISWENPGVGAQAIYALPVKVWNYVGLAQEGNGITDNYGHFKVINLPPGKYVVSAFQPKNPDDPQSTEKCWVVKDIEVSSNRTTQISLAMGNTLSPEDFKKFTRQCQ